MHDPRTLWLTITNIALGAAVIALIIGVATGTFCEFVAKLKKRRGMRDELDRDMDRMFHHHSDARHARH